MTATLLPVTRPTADHVVRAAVRHARRQKLDPSQFLATPLPACGGQSVAEIVQSGDESLSAAALAAFAAGDPSRN